MELKYKTISTPKHEKIHNQKLKTIKEDKTIIITEIRTLYEVKDGQIIWKSRILYYDNDQG